MKYMGSKNRHSAEILPIVLKDRKDGQWYVEPFVGGANLIDKVTGKRIGSDADINTISALLSIRDKLWSLPKDITEFSDDDYKNAKQDIMYDNRGYIGYALSYGGKWFGGWRRDSKGERDYVSEAFRNAEKQNPHLQGISLIHSCYTELIIPENSLIYCDPPYENTTKYSKSFNHSKFWEWCRLKVLEGHQVYVSEYAAPEDFVCVWEKSVASSLTRNTGAKIGVERLFVHKKQFTENYIDSF